MPEVHVSEEIRARIKEFRQVVEAVTETEIGLDECVELVLSQGMDAMLADIVGSVDGDTLLKSFQQLAAQFPNQVYGYVAETLRTGGASQARETLRQRIGFGSTQDSEAARRVAPVKRG